MDVNGSARFRHRKTSSSDRLLAVYPRTTDRRAPASTANVEENELNEDDIFSAGDFSEASNYQNHHYHTSTSSSSGSSSPRHPLINCHVNRAFSQEESFGILAALPENRTNSHLHLYQKTAISSPSSSTSSSSTTSSRFIPSIPKPPQERLPISISLSSTKFHQPQSAPVNVPGLALNMRRRNKEFDEIDEDEDEGDGGGGGDAMLPPHEIVARSQSPILACSVLEGVGRTLKGRDLRQVRNAVWRRTGFLD
ncbi:protein S40-7 [Euphorbia lathyris]|uniref:protein S40-7 n=1 Tax=Euphorbia lathyris TaxID=212925 RepID=UPI0033143931